MALILGIESSCDETAAAVVADGTDVRSSVVASQHALHAPWRGVVPELASRAHTERIASIVQAALDQADVSPDQLDAVAVTARPGLLGALLVGVCGAKAFAWAHELPLVDVDHIAAHVYSARLTEAIEGPYIALVASGGHTALYRADEPLQLLGQTRDDAAGEAFDKVAKMLGLGYPGGPLIDALAREGDPTAVRLPRPRVDGCDFSFSGLKTAVLYALRGPGNKGLDGPPPAAADLAASFQAALVDVLLDTLERAVDQQGLKTVALAGGVAANSALRAGAEALCQRRGWRLAVPPVRYCTDNAAMIAGLGFHLWKAGQRAGWDLEPRPRQKARKT